MERHGAGVGGSQLVGDGIAFSVGLTGGGDHLDQLDFSFCVKLCIRRVVIVDLVAVLIFACGMRRVFIRAAGVDITLGHDMLGLADQIIAWSKLGRLRWSTRSYGRVGRA